MKSYKQMCESTKEIHKELYDAIKNSGGSIEIANIVEEGNMNAVSSNAVAKAISGKTGIVETTVIDKITGLPVRDASVKLDETEKTTDKNGKCSFNNINYGLHILKVTHTDYDDFMESIRLSEDYKSVEVELSDDTAQDAKLNIIVKDNNTGSPVGGAVVKVGNQTLTTDSDGKCSFEYLQYTSYIINAYCNGYDDYLDSIFLEEKETEYTLNMIPTQTTETIRLVGTVQDEQGVLPGVTIDTLTSTTTTTSDNDGYYVLDIPKTSIQDKIIHIIMIKQYYESLEFDISISDDESYYEVENKTLILSSSIGESSSVIGKAQYPDYDTPTIMEGAGNVNMLLLNLTASKMYDCTTKETGDFEKHNIAPGQYNVKIEGNPDYLDQTISNAFFLRPNETLEDVTLELIKTTHDFRLVIAYKDSGEYVADTKVEIFSDSDTKEMIASGTTNEMGKMNFTVSNSLTGELYAKVYLAATDVRTVNLGSAKASSTKVKL